MECLFGYRCISLLYSVSFFTLMILYFTAILYLALPFYTYGPYILHPGLPFAFMISHFYI